MVREINSFYEGVRKNCKQEVQKEIVQERQLDSSTLSMSSLGQRLYML